MFIMHLALGGCLKAPPVQYGITADTGGHIAYILEAAAAQAELPQVAKVSIVTRLFEDLHLGGAHARARETIGPRLTIERLATADRRYLEKEALAAELPAFTAALLRHIAGLRRKPDVIHAHFADAAGIALAARARFGIPVIYTPHALGIDKQRHCGGEGLEARIAAERHAIRMSDGVIVSTADEADRQIGAYGVEHGRPAHRIAPGVPRRLDAEDGVIAASLAEWLHAPDLPIILAIARPVAKKNLAALVRAYGGSAALRARANLVILAGQHGKHASAEERAVVKELHALIRESGLRGHAVLPSRHGAGDVAALYRRAARGGIFVNPALHEPFGLTLIEAAAAGVPVVATREGGPREILATIGHGLLVDPRDDGAIGAACLRILSEPLLHARFAAQGRRHVAAYEWSAYARRSVSVYASLRAAPRLLACDIDNTLTGCEPGARAFAAWSARRTIPFIVATGRSLDEARAVLRHWGLPRPDAFVVDVGTRIMLPEANGSWRECAAYSGALDEGWNREAVRAALAPLGLRPQPTETEGPHKISFFGTRREADAIRDRLQAAALGARVVFSHGRLIDVLAPRAGKAAAIAAYAARHGLTLAHCVAAGDSGNDTDMLETCGHAIIVANAEPALSAIPPRPGLHRVSARHAAGVLEGLAKLGLSGQRSASAPGLAA